MSRSLVTTKWVVCQLISRAPSHTAQASARAAVTHRPTVCTSPFELARAPTSRARTGNAGEQRPGEEPPVRAEVEGDRLAVEQEPLGEGHDAKRTTYL